MFYVACLIIFAIICFALHLYTESKARLSEYPDNFEFVKFQRTYLVIYCLAVGWFFFHLCYYTFGNFSAGDWLQANFFICIILVFWLLEFGQRQPAKPTKYLYTRQFLVHYIFCVCGFTFNLDKSAFHQSGYLKSKTVPTIQHWSCSVSTFNLIFIIKIFFLVGTL